MIGILTPDSFGAVRYPTLQHAVDGVSADDAFTDMLDAAQTSAAVIWLPGFYCLEWGLLLQNSNTLTTMGSQVPLRITGVGGHRTARFERPSKGSGLVWREERGDAVAKIDTRGQGTLVLDNFTLASAEESENVKPFIHTTFTGIQTGPGLSFDGRVYANSVEDAFIFGGDYPHEDNEEYDRGSPNCGFQGYGTIINGVFCNGIRRLALIQRYANSLRISNNTVWSSCGNDSPTGAAIEVNGSPGLVGDNLSVGCTIENNLIELPNYKRGIHARKALQLKVLYNDGYDAEDDEPGGIVTEDMVRIEADCIAPIVVDGLKPKSLLGTERPYLSDPGGVCRTRTSSNLGEPSKLISLDAGDDVQPNLLHRTIFDGPSSLETVRIQPAFQGVDLSLLVAMRRSDEETDRPDEPIHDIEYSGRVIGGGNQAGNYYNTNAGGASCFNQGRSWGFDRNDTVPARRVGGPLKIDAGTGNNPIDIFGLIMNLRSPDGFLGIKMIPHVGVIGAAGSYEVDGMKVVGPRGAPVAAPTGGLVVDVEARAALNAVISRMSTHGLIGDGS